MKINGLSRPESLSSQSNLKKVTEKIQSHGSTFATSIGCNRYIVQSKLYSDSKKGSKSMVRAVPKNRIK
jgi:hypothetical protein